MQQMYEELSDPGTSHKRWQIPVGSVQRRIKTEEGSINCRGLPQGIRVKKRLNWPFLIYEEDGVRYLNPGVGIKSDFEEAQVVGEALL